jgi:UDPglucose 6-dehydrogenase
MNVADNIKNILIIGSGVVGQATGRGLGKLGFNVCFHDINEKVLENLQKEGAQNCRDYNLADYDMSVMSINTPTRNNKIMLHYLHQAIKTLGQKLAQIKHYHLVVIRCTLLPGTTEEKIIPMLEYYSGKTIGQDFGLCYNPEFLRAVSAEDDFLNPWLTVYGAYDQRSSDLFRPLCEMCTDKIEVVAIREAEMMKYMHNIFNATKISYFNEMHMVCNKLGLDSDKIAALVAKSAEGMWRADYGIKGGSPYGGTCLPKDTRAFHSFAHKMDLHPMPLLGAVIKINEQMGEPVTTDNFLEEKLLPEIKPDIEKKDH